MSGRLPTPGEGWGEVIYYIMENLEVKVVQLSEKDLAETNGGLIIEVMLGCAAGYWGVKGLILLFKKQ